MIDVRVAPHDLDAEAAILSAALLDPDVYPLVADRLTAELFYAESNRRIWEVIDSLARADQSVDIVTVAGRLRDTGRLAQVGGSAYLAQLVDAVPAVAHIENYAARVVGLARLREIQLVCRKIAAEAYDAGEDVDAFLDRAEASVYQAAHVSEKREAVPLATANEEAWQQLLKASERRGVPAMPLGLTALDEVFELRPEELTVIAGRPGMGKTSFVLDLARALAERDNGVFFQELEMPRAQLAIRMQCGRAEIDLSRALKGLLYDEEWQLLIEARAYLDKLPILIDDTPSATALHVRAAARKHMAQHPGENGRDRRGVSVVIVDYLQLMSSLADLDAASREQEVSRNMRALKLLSRELHIAVIAVAALSREVERRPDKRPQMNDLRESGAIEQDADNILFLYRPQYYLRDKTPEEDRGVCEIIIAKQRNGPTPIVRVRFRAESATFKDLAEWTEGGAQESTPDNGLTPYRLPPPAPPDPHEHRYP